MRRELSLTEDDLTQAEASLVASESDETVWMSVAIVASVLFVGSLVGWIWTCVRGRPRCHTRVVSTLSCTWLEYSMIML